MLETQVELAKIEFSAILPTISYFTCRNGYTVQHKGFDNVFEYRFIDINKLKETNFDLRRNLEIHNIYTYVVVHEIRNNNINI